MLFGHLPLP
ncbi:hypothetical protein YPPY98_1653, partial [Yersinia pestis PY-98]